MVVVSFIPLLQHLLHCHKHPRQLPAAGCTEKVEQHNKILSFVKILLVLDIDRSKPALNSFLWRFDTSRLNALAAGGQEDRHVSCYRLHGLTKLIKLAAKCSRYYWIFLFVYFWFNTGVNLAFRQWINKVAECKLLYQRSVVVQAVRTEVLMMILDQLLKNTWLCTVNQNNYLFSNNRTSLSVLKTYNKDWIGHNTEKRHIVARSFPTSKYPDSLYKWSAFINI